MSKYFKVCDEYQLQIHSTRVQLENNTLNICDVTFSLHCRWAHQVTSLFRNIAVNIWWTPLTRFNTTDCEGMESSFGGCFICKNSIFAIII